MSKPMSEQMQKVAERYERATGKKFGQMTNADHIRAMTDEELAHLLHGEYFEGFNKGLDRDFCEMLPHYHDWLKRPCKEEV